jgi:hypothetical protein
VTLYCSGSASISQEAVDRERRRARSSANWRERVIIVSKRWAVERLRRQAVSARNPRR